MSTRFRVGVYGTGRGTYLARLFARHDDVQIAAGCDFDPARLASFASSFPDARLFRNYADLLAVDFYTVHLFLEALRNGTPLPIDVYQACDFTLPGILAYRSWVEGGRCLEVPDLRDPAVRERYRNDHFRCPQGEAVREG